MRKIIVVGIIAMLIVTSFSVLAISNKKNNCCQFTTSYSFEIPVIEKVELGSIVYDRVNMSKAPCSGNPGNPRLPSKGAYILLPMGTKVDSITVTHDERVCLGTNFNVEPVGQPVTQSDINSIQLPIPNKAVYKSEDPFPGKLFTRVGTYSCKGYEILVLKLHPVQYIPNSGELFYYTNLTISVETVENENTNALYRGLEKDEFEILKKVDNPWVANTYLELNQNVKYLTPVDYDLLIITTDSLKDGFEPLAQAHNEDGTHTIIKTLSDIGASTPEDIREFIKYAYNNWGIEYVLIGGDYDIVPARLLYYGFWFDDHMQPHSEFGPSDIYYSGLDGPSTPPGDLYEPPGSRYCYAEADSGEDNCQFEVGLFTPSLDLTNYSTAEVSFKYYFIEKWYQYLTNAYAKVNVYSGGNSSENFEENLLELNYNYDGNITLTLHPSNYTDPSNVFIEFYYSITEGYWFPSSFNIDDVCVKTESIKTSNIIIFEEDFEGDVFLPDGWTQIKYSKEGGWKQENYRFKEDFFAEVNVGRACVGDASEVNNFVSKTIEYMDTDSSDSYLKKVLMAGEWLGLACISGGKRLDELIGVCKNHGYTTVGFPRLKYRIDKLYDLIFWRWQTYQIINRINKNVHIINHNGHSDYDYNMRIYAPNVNELTNNKYFFVYSIGCNSGGFDQGDCIAEHLTVKTSHGAFAGIWNARFGWFISTSTDGPSERYHRDFWDAVFSENITVISKANQDSKEDNIWRINSPYMRWANIGLNFFGDPAVQFKYLRSEESSVYSQISTSLQSSSISTNQQNSQNNNRNE